MDQPAISQRHERYIEFRSGWPHTMTRYFRTAAAALCRASTIFQTWSHQTIVPEPAVGPPNSIEVSRCPRAAALSLGPSTRGSYFENSDESKISHHDTPTLQSTHPCDNYSDVRIDLWNLSGDWTAKTSFKNSDSDDIIMKSDETLGHATGGTLQNHAAPNNGVKKEDITNEQLLNIQSGNLNMAKVDDNCSQFTSQWLEREDKEIEPCKLLKPMQVSNNHVSKQTPIMSADTSKAAIDAAVLSLVLYCCGHAGGYLDSLKGSIYQALARSSAGSVWFTRY